MLTKNLILSANRLLPLCMSGLLLVSAYSKGCGGKDRVSEGPPRPATELRSVDFLTKKARASRTEIAKIRSMSAKAKIYSENEGTTISANANIIWIRDSVIWINVKKFGIEAIRALVTQDSVYVLNRLEKTCTIQSINALKKQYGLPDEAGFGTLQDVLLGQASFISDIPLQSDIAEQRHRLRGEKSGTQVQYLIEEGTYVLKNESFLENANKRAIAINFDRHQKTDGLSVLFPYLRHIETHTPASGKIRADIEFSDIELNSQPIFKFEIPGSYQRQ